MSDTFDKKPVSREGQDITTPRIIAAGEHTMATGDEDITIVGLKATDLAYVSLHTQDGSADISDLAAEAEADNLNLKATIAGSGVAVVTYLCVRP